VGARQNGHPTRDLAEQALAVRAGVARQNGHPTRANGDPAERGP